MSDQQPSDDRGEDRPQAPRWRLFVDTGGTFTDCLAIDPAGRTHRAKVLSSSALRGRVTVVEGLRRLRVEAAWAVPEDFFAGCSLRALEGHAQVAVVASSADGTIELAAALDGLLAAGDGCELQSPDEAPVLAARLVTGTRHGRALPPMALRLATTRGTNALLERRGAPTALFVTRGFADLLRIGDQQRRDLFALEIVQPPPLYERVFEVDERLAADGRVLRALDAAAVENQAREALAAGIESAAVALMHSYRNPQHEHAVLAALRRAGFRKVSLSAELAPLIKILPRAETALVNAYLAPVIDGYLDRVAAAFETGDTAEERARPPSAVSIHVMTSAGGLVSAAAYHAKDSLLSGPAGGVVGAVDAGRRSGFARLIAFDMGGTSTDVSRFGGEELEYVYEHRVGDARLVAPALSIETVAAGGGSICAFDGHRLTVGPHSAGARPGPACYGAGGPLTVTDVNLLLGRLDASRFGIPIDLAAARAAAEGLAATVAAAGAGPSGRRGAGEPIEPLLEGLLAITDERMADAIRSISLRRGYDPADHALVAFGGAGGQHACAVAELLGIRTVLVPEDAGLLSAVGLGAAVVERFAQRQVLALLAEVESELPGWLDALAAEARAAVTAEGVAAGEVVARRRLVSLRLSGQESSLEVEPAAGVTLADQFAERYRHLYGYPPAARPLEVESLRAIASSRRPERAAGQDARSAALRGSAPDIARRSLWLGGRWHRDVPVAARSQMPTGAKLDGPALVVEPHGATLVPAGWRVELDTAASLAVRRISSQ